MKRLLYPLLGYGLFLSTAALAGVTPVINTNSDGTILQLEVDGRTLDVQTTANGLSDFQVRAGETTGPVAATWTETDRNESQTKS